MQLKRHSLLETCLSTATGFVVALIIQVSIYPMLGYDVSLHDDVLVTLVFTVASVIRGYIWRRIFNKHTEKRAAK